MRGQLICQFFKSQSSDLCWSEIMFSQIMAKWNKSGKCMSFFNKAFNINYCSLLNMLPNFDVEMFFLTGILVIIILLIVGFVCSIFDQNVKWSFVPSFFFFFWNYTGFWNSRRHSLNSFSAFKKGSFKPEKYGILHHIFFQEWRKFYNIPGYYLSVLKTLHH